MTWVTQRRPSAHSYSFPSYYRLNYQYQNNLRCHRIPQQRNNPSDRLLNCSVRRGVLSSFFVSNNSQVFYTACRLIFLLCYIACQLVCTPCRRIASRASPPTSRSRASSRFLHLAIRKAYSSSEVHIVLAAFRGVRIVFYFDTGGITD